MKKPGEEYARHIGTSVNLQTYRKITVSLGILFAMMPPGSLSALAEDWPMERRDAAGTGYTPEQIAPPLRLAWRVSTTGPSAPSRLDRLGRPILLTAGELTLVGRVPESTGWKGQTTLVNGQGKILWALPDSLPIYLTNRLAIVGIAQPRRNTRVQAYELPSRRLLWTHDMGGRVLRWEGAIVFSTHLFLSSMLQPPLDAEKSAAWTGNRADLRVLYTPDGTVDFSRPGIDPGWSVGPPATDGRNLYYGVSHWFHALNIATLEPQWAVYNGGNAWPMAVKSTVISKGWLHTLQTYDAANAKVSPKMQWVSGAPRDPKHCLAVGPDGATIIVEPSSALDLATGRTVWETHLVAADTAGAGRLVYVAGTHKAHGGFYALEGATGKIRWKYERASLSGIALAPVNRGLLALDSKGTLYRFETASKRRRPNMPAIGLRLEKPPLPPWSQLLGTTPSRNAGRLEIYSVHTDDDGAGHSLWPDYIMARDTQGNTVWQYPRKLVFPGTGASDKEVARDYDSVRFAALIPAAKNVVAWNNNGQVIGIRASDGHRVWGIRVLRAGESVRRIEPLSRGSLEAVVTVQTSSGGAERKIRIDARTGKQRDPEG